MACARVSALSASTGPGTLGRKNASGCLNFRQIFRGLLFRGSYFQGCSCWESYDALKDCTLTMEKCWCGILFRGKEFNVLSYGFCNLFNCVAYLMFKFWRFSVAQEEITKVISQKPRMTDAGVRKTQQVWGLVSLVSRSALVEWL